MLESLVVHDQHDQVHAFDSDLQDGLGRGVELLESPALLGPDRGAVLKGE